MQIGKTVRTILAMFFVFGLMQGFAFAGVSQTWTLIDPEGVIQVEPVKVNPHPSNLEGKTVLLLWNGKHNGDHFLTRIGELLSEKVQNLNIVKSWELVPGSDTISGSPAKSLAKVKKLMAFKPDITIGSQCD